MKKQILLGITIAALGATAAIAQEQSHPQQLPQVGRFQVIEATFTSAPDNPEKQFMWVLRLDTATGEMVFCDYIYLHANDKQWHANGNCAPFQAPQGYLINKRQKK